MRQITGKTYGFGRVSPIARPSQFAPTRGPGARDRISRSESAPARLRDRRGRRTRIVAVCLVAVVAIAFGVLALLSMSNEPEVPRTRTVSEAGTVSHGEAASPARSTSVLRRL